MALSSLYQKQLFILGSFVVLLLAVLLYWRINALVHSFRQIDHASKVELSLQHTLGYMIDAETGQRGFLLTGDSTLLKPYLLGQQRINSAMLQVQQLIKGNIQQEQNFSALKMLIDQQFIIMQKALTNAHTSQDTLNQYMTRGKASMDRIRYQINRMALVEQTQLNQREHQKNRYVKLTPISLLILVFAMLIIIGFSYYGLTKQLQQSQRYATELDYLNGELVLKNKQLENSVEELNAFNYIASHDLKEPLRKILFFTDLLTGKKEQLDEEGTQYVEKIRSSGDRMKSLLDDLLTYTKASMTERTIETVDLNEVVHAVEDSLSDMIAEKHAKVINAKLPEIGAVPSQMQQLFENLISNSVKYSKPDVPPVITIDNQTVSRSELPPTFEATHQWYHCIRFSDNGIGFSQENADKVFVLFQRLHQRHEFSGTGIGLTICRKIVQNHNGYITVKSEVDNGTTFFIYFPA